jgi:hypothetical protein
MAKRSNKVTLRELIEELRHDLANVKARLDALERPKIARVIRDPSRPAEVGSGS